MKNEALSNQEMNFVVKKYYDLTPKEIWEMYRLRSQVFVVEQNCVYLDIDEFDLLSYHVLLMDGGELIAYLRVLPQGTVFKEASIGRVISVRRRQGIGTKTVAKGIEVAQEKFSASVIEIEAQTYARKLYEKLGFVQTSDEFLEDGIPHIKMEWHKKPTER